MTLHKGVQGIRDAYSAGNLHFQCLLHLRCFALTVLVGRNKQGIAVIGTLQQLAHRSYRHTAAIGTLQQITAIGALL